MEAIDLEAPRGSLVVSLDADTWVPRSYLSQVRKAFRERPSMKGLVATYYHPLVGEKRRDRALLRYEIYMRAYLIGLLKIRSPYAFTALGSVISFRLEAYKRVGGFPARAAGEDFYFLQKLRKFGELGLWGAGPVRPSSRPSLRVPFGTGPAVSRWMRGEGDGYPLFAFEPFLEIEETMRCFKEIFHEDVETPMDDFFERVFRDRRPFALLRKDHKTLRSFVRACHERLDGLRIFQFLRSRRAAQRDRSDEEILKTLLSGPLEDDLDLWRRVCSPKTSLRSLQQEKWSFESLPLEVFSALREFLVWVEWRLRQEVDRGRWKGKKQKN